jgi:hypothetical protein
MDVITLVPPRCWLARLSGRNGLVRRSDRVQALVAVTAIVVVMLAAPVAAATGTAVHDVRADVYAEQAQHRHSVLVTAVEPSTTTATPNSVKFDVTARWNASGSYHVERVESPRFVKAGERFPIWVDDSGNRAAPPRSPSQAGPDAVGAAVLLWISVALVAAGTYGAIRLRLNRARQAQWDREFAALTDGGGRRNRQS